MEESLFNIKWIIFVEYLLSSNNCTFGVAREYNTNIALIFGLTFTRLEDEVPQGAVKFLRLPNKSGFITKMLK